MLRLSLLFLITMASIAGAQPATLDEQQKQTDLLKQILAKINGGTPAPTDTYEVSLARAWAKEPDSEKKFGPTLADAYKFSTLFADALTVVKVDDFWNSFNSFEKAYGAADRLPLVHAAIAAERAKQIPEDGATPLTPDLRKKIKSFMTQTSNAVAALAGGTDPIPPTPPPGPVPPPPLSPAAFVVGVTDNDARTLQHAVILTDNDLLAYMQTKKIGWRVIDDNSEAYKTYGIDKILADQKMAPPAVVAFGQDGSVRVAPPPTTSDGVKKFIEGKTLVRFDAKLGFHVYHQGKEKRYLTRLPASAAMLKSIQDSGVKRFSEAKTVIPREQWRTVNRRKSLPLDWILDQNGHGSCVGHGAAQALRATRFFAGMKDIKLSPTCVYGQINGNADQGAIIGDSLLALQKTGTTTFATIGENLIYTRNFPSGWQTEAKRFRIEQAYTCPTFDEQVSALQLGYVVVYGMMVGNNYEQFDKYGVAGFASGQGNHCMMSDGCAKLADGRWVLDNVNSWGADWGPWSNGRCYLSQNHIDRADNSDAYAVRTATEDPQETIRPPLLPKADGAALRPLYTGPAIFPGDRDYPAKP